MSDPVKVLENEDKPVDTDIPPEEKQEEKPKDVSNSDVVNAIKEVKDALTKPNQPAPSREQIRAALKEKSGFTDAQLDVMESMNAAVFRQNSTQMAELQEKVAWSEFKEDLGSKIDPAIEKIMKEELKQYDPEMRGDKVLLKKVFYLAKGIQAEKAEKTRKTDPNANDEPNNSDKVVGRKIVTDQPGSANGLENAGGKPKAPAGDLTDDEKTVASKMGISHEDYAKSKESKIVGERKPKAVFRGS